MVNPVHTDICWATLVLLMLTGCGQMVYTYEGTVTAGTRGAHSFDREPGRGEPVRNAVVWAVVDTGQQCPALDSKWRRATSDDAGRYFVQFGSAPEWHGQRLIQVCFAAEGFEPYGFLHWSQTRCGGSEDDRKCYLNVKLRPVTGRSKPPASLATGAK